MIDFKCFSYFIHVAGNQITSHFDKVDYQNERLVFLSNVEPNSTEYRVWAAAGDRLGPRASKFAPSMMKSGGIF
ncbi:hypothetical protein BWD42_12180 [Sphingobacterium sp. CZ-UAM]|nr:hypothetical protein BWD42_12180 [Sphingobacterium sp. CZ-UAM]